MTKIAVLLPNLRGGGAQRAMALLAQGLAKQDFDVDLVLASAEGPYLSQVPSKVDIVDLGAHRALASLPNLVRYLRRERPEVLLSAMNHVNVVALWARKLSRVSMRTVVSVHNTLSQQLQNASSLQDRLALLWIRPFYPWADAVVAVSKGIAEDLIRLTGLPQEKVQVIYNPVITPKLFERAEQPVDHPWFASGEPPVILGVGRLTKQKDFPTLIRAFSIIRRKRLIRLVILGEGEDRPKLEALVRELGLEEEVDMPGFVENPYAYMKRAAVFVLSSAWEGFGNVLVEAMAVGIPVVSTDCPNGPAEILEGGKWGRLVPVGDVHELAEAVEEAMINGVRPPAESWEPYTLETVVTQYAKVLLPWAD